MVKKLATLKDSSANFKMNYHALSTLKQKKLLKIKFSLWLNIVLKILLFEF